MLQYPTPLLPAGTLSSSRLAPLGRVLQWEVDEICVPSVEYRRLHNLGEESIPEQSFGEKGDIQAAENR